MGASPCPWLRRALASRAWIGLNTSVPDGSAAVPDASKSSDSLPAVPLEPLKRWPDACRWDAECEIGGIVYPAPDDLSTSDALFWVDFLQLRVAAARSMLNNVLAGAIGAIFGLVTAVSTLAFTAKLWVIEMAVLIAVVLVPALSWLFLHDSEHHALEQRWLLYRCRSREEDEVAKRQRRLES